MKVFVVGNIAMDETIAVNRLPREGESIFGTRVSNDLGGKGANQAIVFARSGIPTILIAVTGTDMRADLMRSFLATEPMTTRLIQRPSLVSDSSMILKDETGGNAIVTTVDCAQSLDVAEIEERMTDAVSGDLMVLQGNLNLAATKQIIAKARKRDMQIVLNPSPFEVGIEALLIGVNILFLNHHEALQITGYQGIIAVQKLLERGIETVVLSMGEKGALLGTKAGTFTVHAHACDAVDSTGAGDTFLGVALAAAVLRQCNVDERALEIAAQAAALTVSRFGTRKAFPTEAELGKLLAP